MERSAIQLKLVNLLFKLIDELQLNVSFQSFVLRGVGVEVAAVPFEEWQGPRAGDSLGPGRQGTTGLHLHP